MGFKVLRKLGWAVLLAASGVPRSEGPRPEAATAAAPPQELGPVRPAAEPVRASWSWPEEEDEFEGEGWSFWGWW